MLIDTHAHVNFSVFKDDYESVIRRALDNKIWMILVGSDIKTSQAAVDLANKYDKGVYAAVGLYPNHTYQESPPQYGYEKFNRAAYERMAEFERVVAIGEIGLDYYRLPENIDIEKNKSEQKEIFTQELALAAEKKLPVIIHCREAHNDALNILKDYKKEYAKILPRDRPWGVIHCFSGNEDLAWEYFSLGMIISFTGLITFNDAWNDLIRKLPLDKFVVETDCPFLTPAPFRGERNEPTLVENVARQIALIKNMDVKKIAEATTGNARRLFNI
jgi:TatD DNase family protein